MECKGKSQWPELVGARGEHAVTVIEEENKHVNAIIVLVGTPVTKDFRCDRVWVWVDKKDVVVVPPRIG